MIATLYALNPYVWLSTAVHLTAWRQLLMLSVSCCS
jgi:hypothetical protein